MAGTGTSSRREKGRGAFSHFVWLPFILIFALGLPAASALAANFLAGDARIAVAKQADDAADPTGTMHAKEQCQAHFACSAPGYTPSAEAAPVARDVRRPGPVQPPPTGLAPAPPDHPPSMAAHG